jgi:hypothetical protein
MHGARESKALQETGITMHLLSCVCMCASRRSWYMNTSTPSTAQPFHSQPYRGGLEFLLSALCNFDAREPATRPQRAFHELSPILGTGPSTRNIFTYISPNYIGDFKHSVRVFPTRMHLRSVEEVTVAFGGEPEVEFWFRA